MMELNPIERLRIHLILHHPKVRIRHIKLSKKPGYLYSSQVGMIDIRGASYPLVCPPTRLWDELHDYFTSAVMVLKRKNGQATVIEYDGDFYSLNQHKTHRNTKKERSAQ